MIVIDLNVLVHAHNASSPFHHRGLSCIEQVRSEGETIAIPWSTFTGFLRLATTAHVTRRPLNNSQVYGLIHAWLAHPQVIVPEPGRRFWHILQQIGSDGQVRGFITRAATLLTNQAGRDE